MTLVVGHAFLSPVGGVLREHAAVLEIQRLLTQPGPRQSRTVMISYCWDSTSFALKLCRDLAPLFSRVVMDRLGDMQGFVGESMERMVAESDVVIAVVSKGYAFPLLLTACATYCSEVCCGLHSCIMLGVPVGDRLTRLGSFTAAATSSPKTAFESSSWHSKAGGQLSRSTSRCRTTNGPEGDFRALNSTSSPQLRTT
jgi:hypothetical protein